MIEGLMIVLVLLGIVLAILWIMLSFIIISMNHKLETIISLLEKK